VAWPRRRGQATGVLRRGAGYLWLRGRRADL